MAGRKTSPPPWPVADGFARLPTMWFGSNVSGSDAPAQLALIARHRLGVYGWQQSTAANPAANLGAGDAFQAAAAAHLADYLDAQPAQRGSNRTLVGVYRQIMIAQQLFAGAHAVAGDAAYDGWWLHDNSTTICRFGMPWGTSDPVWNFSVAAAADYWVDAVVGALVAEASSAGFNVVFFDDSDYNFCGFWATAEGNFGALSGLAPLHAANNAVIGRTAAALNAAGIIPLFSSVNVLAAASAGIPGAPAATCALPEDATLAALQGTTYARFYEFFPALELGGPDVAATATANAILEGAAGVPIIAHFFVPSCPAAPNNCTRPGRLGGAIELQLAHFLIVQEATSVLSISSDWFDASFCWHAEFDVEFGAPLGPALRTGVYTWERNLTRSRAFLDVLAKTGEVLLL